VGIIRRIKGDDRSFDRILFHYQIERGLADRLRNAGGAERKALYATVYDELFRLIPDHPQLQKEKTDDRRVRASSQFGFVQRFLRDGSSFLEVGAGDCVLSSEVAKHVKRVFAFDVATEITKGAVFPENMSLITSKTGDLRLDSESIDIVFSSDVMEHLHPDDAYEQLEAIYSTLKPSGLYVCHTPNGLTGPWDISRYFDEVPTCLHLHEYTVRELDGLFKKVGFRTRYYVGGRGKFMRFPIILVKTTESLLEVMPRFVRRLLTDTLLFKAVLGVNIVGAKDNKTSMSSPVTG
jgi:2-polyprenyl-3-methyl-5-hydroxy-6-metoxy-1,4-benzoquinol methylase